MSRVLTAILDDLALLTPRERSVVDLALDGRTDDAIASTLGLSVSTVNTYWTRIRGKLGQYSRTELVSRLLRAEMASQCANLQAENAALVARLEEERKARVHAEAALSARGRAPWTLLALEHLTEAAYVIRTSGVVAYANLQARRFFRAEAGDLDGVPVWDLTFREDRIGREPEIRAFFADETTRRADVGIDRPLYARRRDGTECRITLSAEWFETDEGRMAVVVLREFLDGVETIVQALRAVPVPGR